jgi:hypothetical protein
MKTKHILITLLILFKCISAFCQQPPPEFFNGLDLLQTDKTAAKKDFLVSIQKSPQFHGAYHFLGVIYLDEQKPDSAIWCFKKAVELNKANVNHTREMAYTRLVQTYLGQKDFKNAFDTGWEGLQQYADSKLIGTALRDNCLWSFYTIENGLDPAYLSTNIKPEYVVNCISEEYLILRNLRVNGESLQFTGQALVNKNGSAYDVLRCKYAGSGDKDTSVYFKINWDMNTYMGEGKVAPQQPVIDDTSKPVYDRVGASLVADNKAVLKDVIEKLLVK